MSLQRQLRELRKKAGRSDISRESILDEIQRLEEQKRDMEMGLVGQMARRKAIDEQIGKLTAETREKAHNAPEIDAFKVLMEMRKREVKRLEALIAAKPNQVLVAIVPAIETSLIPPLSQLANHLGGLVVVLLQGFVPDEMPDEFTSGLKRTNLEIISCSQGNLAAAIEKLGGSLLFTGRSAVSLG